MNVTKISPTLDRILVKKLKEEVSEGGLYIPITSEDEPMTQVEILAIGPDVTSLSVGQVGLINKHSGTEVQRNSDVLLTTSRDIIAIVR